MTIKPKLTLFYFSGSGNTEWVAEKFSAELSGTYRVELIDIDEFERFGKRFDDDFEKAGVIYPVHALNAPANVLKFLKKSLPTGAGRKFFIVKSPGDPFFNGGATTEIRKMLNKNGYIVTHESLVVMPANVFMRYRDSFISKLLEVAEKKIRKAGLEIMEDKIVLHRNPWWIRFSTWISSRMETAGSPMFGKDLRVNNDCTKCGLCMKICPKGNITADKEGKPRFGWKCMICMRCIYKCPDNAISPFFFKFFKVKNFYKISNLQKPSDLTDPTAFEKGFGKYFNS
jgi:ferredoxin/flavodoxin